MDNSQYTSGLYSKPTVQFVDGSKKQEQQKNEADSSTTWMDEGKTLTNEDMDDRKSNEDFLYEMKLEKKIEEKSGSNSGSDDEMIVCKKEDRHVFVSRCAMIFVLFVAALTVSVWVYRYAKKTEQSRFEAQTNDNAYKILDSIGTKIDTTYDALDSFATTLVSYAHATNQTFPYVTMEDFGVRASKLRSTTNGVFIYIAYVVQSKDRDEYEEYAFSNNEWVNDTLKIQETDENYFGPMIYNGSTSYSIFGDFDIFPYNETRILLPIWQHYPVIHIYEPVYNKDISLDNEYIDETLSSHKSILGEPYMLLNLSDPYESEYQKDLINLFAAYIHPDGNPDEPTSHIMYPIIDEVNKVRIVTEDNYIPTDHKAVGVIGSSFYWRDMIKNILPFGNRGMDVVFESECSQPFTYQINGPYVKYLGRGDLHDTEFNVMCVQTSTTNLSEYSFFNSSYTGAPINENYCPISIKVCPSKSMEKEYCTMDPLLFALITFFMFAFTSCVFFIYDYNVERRQDIEKTSSNQGGAIVSSLNPKHIRNQLLADASKEKEAEKVPATNRATLSAPGLSDKNDVSYQIKSFLEYDVTPAKCLDSCDETEIFLPPIPIAEIYENTTVMFANIAGFSKWSSNHDPFNAFTLLETLHGAFDVLAKKHQILKIEAIGDTYVAVAGIPENKSNHASAMAQFASEIMDKMTELTIKLEPSFGRDTTDLRLCVGLNSGATTAGVLRSVKSRFQIFGETVALAECMQNTATPGRIQCTETTAYALLNSGKAHCMTRSNDYVISEGFGKLQTYWIEIPKKPQPSAINRDAASLNSDAIIFGTKNSFSHESYEELNAVAPVSTLMNNVSSDVAQQPAVVSTNSFLAFRHHKIAPRFERHTCTVEKKAFGNCKYRTRSTKYMWNR